jgi:hypothetical protein
MRIAVVMTLATLMVVALAAEVTAQRLPMAGPNVDLGAPTNRGIAGQSVPWSGPPRVNLGQPRQGVGAYFQPTDRPFQGTASRRWQQRLNEIYGGIPADRNVPPPSQRAVPPFNSRSRVFVGPQSFPIIECFGTRCQRVFPPIQ